VRLHPERHVGEDHGREKVRRGLEVRLNVGAVVVADEQVGGDAPAQGQYQCGGDATEDIAKVLSLPDALQIGEQYRHDHRGLDALAKKDDEGRNHEWETRPKMDQRRRQDSLATPKNRGARTVPTPDEIRFNCGETPGGLIRTLKY